MALGLLRSHLVQADDYAACRRRRVELFDRPLIWALQSSVTSSPDALSRCKRAVDRSWVCPRLSPLAPIRSTTPHHLISGRDRVPDQHPVCTGTGSEAGGTSLLSGMVEPGAECGHAPISDIPARPGYVPMIARSGQVLTTASAGTRPVSTYLQIATSSLRARATMAIRLTRPVVVPTRSRYQRALGLMTQPQPGELDERLARAPVAGLADALFTARAAAGIGTGCQARIGRHVAAVGEVAVEDLQLQHGCDLR